MKRWAGISTSAETGVLFRSKDNFGLGLTSVVDHYLKMQLIKYDLFQNSTDEVVKELMAIRASREENLPGCGSQQVCQRSLTLKLI